MTKLWLSIAILLFSACGLIMKAIVDAVFDNWKVGKDPRQVENRKVCQIKWLARLNLALLGLTCMASVALIGIEAMTDKGDATQLSALEKRVEELERFIRGPRPPGGGPTLEDQLEALDRKIDAIADRCDLAESDIDDLKRSTRRIWETMRKGTDPDQGGLQTA